MQSSHRFLSRLLHYRSSKHTSSILVPFPSPTQNTDTKENAAAAASTCSKNLSCLGPIFTNQNPTFPFGSYAQSSGVFFGNSPKGIVFLGYLPLGNDQKQQNWHQFLSHRRFFTRAKQIKKIEINDQHSQRAVTTALWCNFLVFSLKFGVRLSTSSHVMLAEVVHAVADFANQALLAYGSNRSRHAPDALHLPPEHMEYAALVLGGSFIIEGASLIVATQAVRKGAAAEGMTVRDYVWRGHDSTAVAVMTEAGRLTRAGKARPEAFNRRYSSMAQCIIPTGSTARTAFTVEDQCDQQATSQNSDRNAGGMKKHQIGKNVSRRDKVDFLLKTFLNLKDNKEAVYGALDAWVAWEQDFPLVSLRRALIALEKEHQWHRVIQVIKWMLSKGQGKTMGTYMQLIRALDMEHRAEEAHIFWQKRIGSDLHSVPWQLCNLMIGVYYRNNMLEHLVKLFKRLEAFDRKPPERSIVQKVADAYEMLGMPEEKERIELKFSNLFLESVKDHSKKSRHASSKKKKKSGKKNQTPTPDISADVAVGMDNVID